jgi:hypothetical protein
VSTLAVLFVLLVVAYLGGFLMGGRGLQGRGLPSGSEWVVLGFVVGPSALGAVSGQDLGAFDPIAVVAVGWVALLAGIGFGTSGPRRIPAARLAAGGIAGLITGAGAAALAWGAFRWSPAAGAAVPGEPDRLLVALAAGVALAGTTRHAVQWAVDRLGARGPLTEVAGDLVRGQEVVPLLAIGALVFAGGAHLPGLPPGTGALLGAALGGVSALLLGSEMRRNWLWTLLFGMSLLGTGAALQLGVSVVLVLFCMGLTLALTSPLRREIRDLPAWIEGAVVVPALFLAGSRIRPDGAALWVVAATLVGRVAAQALVGTALRLFSQPARRGGPAMAFALGAAGPIPVVVGLAFQLRYPGPIGDTALLAAAVATVAGEFTGVPALRRALRRAGELSEPGADAEGAGAPAAAGDAGRTP